MLKQLSVFAENEVGNIAKVTTVLRENNINLRAIASFDSPEFGILRMIVDKPDKTKEILTHKGFVVKITDVIGVELEDRPGGLDHVLNLIADAGISVNYIYSFVIKKDTAPVMVMHVNNMESALNVLKTNGIKTE